MRPQSFEGVDELLGVLFSKAHPAKEEHKDSFLDLTDPILVIQVLQEWTVTGKATDCKLVQPLKAFIFQVAAEDQEGNTLCTITFFIGNAVVIIEYESFLVPLGDLMFHHFV